MTILYRDSIGTDDSLQKKHTSMYEIKNDLWMTYQKINKISV